ncbi:hypothetical protein SDC9_170392 [bioreactor metagenome]|uniref:Uncharacterized protein n=1 Tax=bioreactor metagenome TaxID=1076179 RepID=A0A645G7X3_9ZZZZ
MFRERARSVKRRGRENLVNLGKREIQLTIEENLPKPFNRRIVIIPIAALSDLARLQKADLVVVVQRADRNTGQFAERSDGMMHRFLTSCGYHKP